MGKVNQVKIWFSPLTDSLDDPNCPACEV